jgi:hypothetical protein
MKPDNCRSLAKKTSAKRSKTSASTASKLISAKKVVSEAGECRSKSDW